jgi:hypothetical protein
MNRFIPLLFLLSLVGCKDRFDIPLRENDKSFLIVDGVIAAGQDSTIFLLSKSVNVKDGAKFVPELRANVSVEAKTGQTFLLKEMGNGKYASGALGLSAGADYRLRIKTSNNKEYLSDFVTAKITPDIDSISWKKENGDLMIYANTHDASNDTKYYLWDYDEAWEIRSFFTALYQYINDSTIIPALSYHSTCWKFGSSTALHLGSSVLLSSDIIKEAPLLLIPKGSEKLSVRYSILVRQQSLTKEAFEYLTMMKKNTESLGSVFDPLPSELKGNIHCLSDPDQGVIGFVRATSISKKRIFITSNEANWTFAQPCYEFRVKNDRDSIRAYFPGFLPWEYDTMTGYYLSAPAPCVDCTQRGGSLNRPSYW